MILEMEDVALLRLLNMPDEAAAAAAFAELALVAVCEEARRLLPRNIVCNHSTHLDGLLPALASRRHGLVLAKLVPAQLKPFRGAPSASMRLDVCERRVKLSGFELRAHKGAAEQLVFAVVDGFRRDDEERTAGQLERLQRAIDEEGAVDEAVKELIRARAVRGGARAAGDPSGLGPRPQELNAGRAQEIQALSKAAHKAKFDAQILRDRQAREERELSAAQRKLVANKDFMKSHVVRGGSADSVNRARVSGYIHSAAKDAKERGRT
ncbi:hypothetical protein EMIHUDRAFT_214623 [Emiliania huxleyi CCMP1516]|uniref:Uncharacterized protein n=2 Tax=Emiliania huxleyi TaxID=2903 RepID=A0A0D3IJ84_EMIH1|nr:hypothetical protein EMIHUDRAFT_214623 [Emiliania huxleyi CCMP1516]EOD11319.1 hypothetical protein EMIHUDRAFT_214623 [Emiliania huxleyi CCMP1516]|eukprot:XP_005763748.1 hypothetical protein EMIHUDRAFT_214623 [Emiliania huxleyi CCMP1516]